MPEKHNINPDVKNSILFNPDEFRSINIQGHLIVGAPQPTRSLLYLLRPVYPKTFLLFITLDLVE